MSMNRYMDGRQVFDRRHGPSTTAAGDGQEGIFSGVLHTAPSAGSCQVIIPALGLTSYRTANVAPYVSGSAGDTCLIAFDEGKIPWVISAQNAGGVPGDFVFSGAVSRVGSLICHGASYAPSTYPALFAAISNAYGGTTSVPLLPDLRGRMPMGAGTGTASGATAFSVGNQPTSGAGGEQTHTLTTTEMPSHNHPISGGADTFPADGSGSPPYFVAGGTDFGFEGATIANSGGGGAHNTLPPVSVGNWFIVHG